ncbi:MAG TPA: hypothetical protein IAC67_04995 [Candidatus Coproplasma excrementipullorum]|nr:hypothetical protein [Candidatus Coproplasma excrementipullorum]
MNSRNLRLLHYGEKYFKNNYSPQCNL